MFSNSVAITVAESGEGHWRLAEFAEHAKFFKTIKYQNVHVLGQQRGPHLPFCLIEGTTPTEMVKETVTDLRASEEIDVSFMPVVMLTTNTTASYISGCIQAGCDDIIGLPYPSSAFVQRIRMQIETPLNYYKTEEYFGPDRRRGNMPGHQQKRGAGGVAFEKFSIRRHRRAGVKILTHQRFDADDIMAAFA